MYLRTVFVYSTLSRSYGPSFNNLTLKYVDASFYQVASPTHCWLLFPHGPSLRILLSCGLVAIGFFIGVLIDLTHHLRAYFRRPDSPPLTGTKAPSLIGVVFGFVSSVSTPLRAVVIERSLDASGREHSSSHGPRTS
jgi:solute carrier family 35 (GDP-fucose transporter), member C1